MLGINVRSLLPYRCQINGALGVKFAALYVFDRLFKSYTHIALNCLLHRFLYIIELLYVFGRGAKIARNTRFPLDAKST